MTTCPLCDTLARLRPGDRSHIAELSESTLILGDNQGCPGWCVLILKDHHEHLELLPADRRMRLLDDVAAIGAALRMAFSPLRINYASFCNQVPHLHWHIMPRREGDPFPKDPVWAWPEAAQRGDADEHQRRRLIESIRTALPRVTTGTPPRTSRGST
jgi:diadenosine tetraphosphate (Ap4A) HIT family hydrolase